MGETGGEQGDGSGGLIDEAGFERAFAPELAAYGRAEDLSGLAPNQRGLYLLVMEMFSRYTRSYRASQLWGLAKGVLAGLPCGVALTGGVAWAASAALPATAAGWSVYGAAGAAVVVSAFFRLGFENAPVWVSKDGEGRFRQTHLGKVERVLSPRHMVRVSFILGLLLASQFGLLYFSPTHLGLGDGVGLQASALLTLDNLLHGVTLDVLEIYGVSLEASFEEASFFTRTVFLVFRLLYDGFVLILAYVLWQRFRVRGFFDGFRQDFGPRELANWMTGYCSSGAVWLRKYPNEILFVMLAEEYIRGKFALVTQISHQFWLEASADLRHLFVHPQSGVLLFRASDADDDGDDGARDGGGAGAGGDVGEQEDGAGGDVGEQEDGAGGDGGEREDGAGGDGEDGAGGGEGEEET